MNTKKIGEIFSDYNTNSNIKYAEVKTLNVIKKKNILQVLLYFDEYIEIKELWYFEKFLKERFNFNDVDIKIDYFANVEKKSIKNEWKNLIAYMSHKYPLARPMLLLKSDIEIDEDKNNIKIKMHIKGADFLKAKKVDKELQKMIKNIFGKKYSIDIVEEISSEEIKKVRERIKQQEIEIRDKIQENLNKKEINEKEKINNSIEEYKDPDYRPPVDNEVYIPEIREENIEYIMGKPSRAKEKFMKIKDITANDGRVTLEGKILSTDVRETKSGKGMMIFDLYDGTGTITCKSFAKDFEEGKLLVEKIKDSKSIKIIGKAGLDTYAGDTTVISNTIISTNVDMPEPPEENEEIDMSSPLIFGVSQNVTEPLVKVEDLTVDDGKVCIQGEVIYTEDKTLKSGKTLFSFDVYDGTSSITCKAFLNKDVAKRIMGRIKNSNGIKVSGTAQMDTFSNELTIMANTIVETEGIKKEVREDNAPVKRVELHMHTQMSQMDGMTSATDLIKRAMKWGWKSIAITDHGGVQAFPEAHKLLRI